MSQGDCVRCKAESGRREEGMVESPAGDCL
jgi:hypothetical protein